MAKDNSPSWMRLLRIDTSPRKIQQCKIKGQKKTKSTQLKTVGGFLPDELGGTVEEGNESSQGSGCRRLPLLCPARIQPRVAKEHLSASNRIRDLVPLFSLWPGASLQLAETRAGVGQPHRAPLHTDSFLLAPSANSMGLTWVGKPTLFFIFFFFFLIFLPFSVLLTSVKNLSSDFSFLIFITLSQFSHFFSEKAHLLLSLSALPPDDPHSFFSLACVVPLLFLLIPFILRVFCTALSAEEHDSS